MSKYKLTTLVMVPILVLDQLTKLMALAYLKGQVLAVTPFFNLVFVWNHGVSFGLFSNSDHDYSRYFLIGMTCLITLGLIIWLTKLTFKPMVIAISAVIAGAIGNIIDRFAHGAVVDFLDFHAFGYHWPAFNIADSAIVLGIAFMVIDGLFFESKRNTDSSNYDG